MDRLYLMQLEEIKNLEIQFLKNPKPPRAMKLRNRFRNLFYSQNDIPDEDKIILRKRLHLYDACIKGDIFNFVIRTKIKSNPLPSY
jgi:hypothetical protein